MSSVSTHVLDMVLGVPAAGVGVVLQQADAEGYREIGQAVTDDDGRAADLGPGWISPGNYRLVFDTGSYFAEHTSAGVGPGQLGQPCYFPEVVVTFRVDDSSSHHHTPLLLSPFGYTTYRGS